jgi:hypothetical protein
VEEQLEDKAAGEEHFEEKGLEQISSPLEMKEIMIQASE